MQKNVYTFYRSFVTAIYVALRNEKVKIRNRSWFLAALRKCGKLHRTWSFQYLHTNRPSISCKRIGCAFCMRSTCTWGHFFLATFIGQSPTLSYLTDSSTWWARFDTMALPEADASGEDAAEGTMAGERSVHSLLDSGMPSSEYWHWKDTTAIFLFLNLFYWIVRNSIMSWSASFRNIFKVLLTFSKPSAGLRIIFSLLQLMLMSFFIQCHIFFFFCLFIWVDVTCISCSVCIAFAVTERQSFQQSVLFVTISSLHTFLVTSTWMDIQTQRELLGFAPL